MLEYDSVVTLTIVRSGNLDLPSNVTLTTVSGTADGVFRFVSYSKFFIQNYSV